MGVYFCATSSACLFCSKKCSREDTAGVEQLPNKNEGEKVRKVTTDCNCYKGPVRFLGSSVVEKSDGDEVGSREQLKYVFVLRELLDYPKRKCAKLWKEKGQSSLEKETPDEEGDGWFSVCQECSKIVDEGHFIYHEIEKLKKNFDELKRKLKDLVAIEDAGVSGHEENEEAEGSLFSQVREYFRPSRISKPEVGGASSISDNEGQFDGVMLRNEDNFEDGSDWAPSDAEQDLTIQDVKPNVQDLQPQGTSADGTAGNAKSAEEENSSKRSQDKPVQKPCPKSKKSTRVTRRSLRNKKAPTSDENQGDDDQSGEEASSASGGDSESSDSGDVSFDSADSDYEQDQVKSYKCKVCSTVFSKKAKLRDHELLHSSQDSFRCTLCPFVSAKKPGLNMHLRKVHKTKDTDAEDSSVKVEESESSTTPPKGKRPAKAVRVGEHQCTYCPVVYQTAHRLKEHLEHHLNMTNDMIKCGQCNYICMYERGMKIHVTKYHKNGGPPRKPQVLVVSDEDQSPDVPAGAPEESNLWHCNICTAIYKTRGRLREHKKLHANKNAPRCADCNYVCNTRKGIIMHMHEEHGVRPIRTRDKERSAKRLLRKQSKTFKNDPMQCSECPAKYYTERRFQAHTALHSNDINYPCEKCGWVFSCGDKRDYHMKLSHGSRETSIQNKGKAYQCNHCDAPAFSARYKFREHLLLNHKDRVFQCSSCDLVYESRQLYDLHVTSCNLKQDTGDGEDEVADGDEEEEREETQSKKLFSCVECKAKFSKQDMLNRHFALKHSTEQYPCTACTSVFPTESRLRYHMARQHDKLQNICQVCGYKSHGASHLRLHMQKHTKERLFACEICGKTFVSPTYLTAHKQKEHYTELGLEPLKCEECDLLFPTNSILKYHKQKVHEKKFKFFCDVCGKGFLFASGLKNHSIIHSTDRTEVCQFCGAAYVHNRVLMEHMKHHHPEEFAAMKGLDPDKVKVSSVVTQGPFICKICHVELTSRWGLHQHQKSHTEIYDKYKCGVCGKGYSSPAGVKRHEDTAHAETVHECSNCGKTFPCKDYLRYHLKNHCSKVKSAGVAKSEEPEEEPVPTSSKRRKRYPAEVKIGDPHIVKEAGQLCIVTPNMPSSSSGVGQQTQILSHVIYPVVTQEQASSGASSPSSSFVGYSQPSSLAAGNDEGIVNSFYRSYMTQPSGYPPTNNK